MSDNEYIYLSEDMLYDLAEQYRTMARTADSPAYARKARIELLHVVNELDRHAYVPSLPDKDEILRRVYER